jgi:hypothetical protein
MSQEVVPRKGQKGTVFTATVEEPNPAFDPSLPEGPGNLKYLIVNLTNAVGQANKIEFKRPNKSTFQMDATVLLPATNGQMQYINYPNTASILDMAGLWEFRGIANFSDGSEFPGSWVEQRVGK